MIKRNNLKALSQSTYLKRYKLKLIVINKELEILNKANNELVRYKDMLEQIIQHSIKVRNNITKITQLIQEEDLINEDRNNIYLYKKVYAEVLFYPKGSIEIIKVI